MKYIKLYFIAK